MIRVRVFLRSGRKFYECQWEDPATGLKKTRSTKSTRLRDAERFAARLEQDLNNPSDDIEHVRWDIFRQAYEASEYPGKSIKTQRTTAATFNLVEKALSPARPTVIDTRKVAKLAHSIRARKRGNSEFTVKRHLIELRKILRWALRNHYIQHLPNFEMPKKLKGAKSRAVTSEEFDRILKVIPDVIGEDRAASWEFLITGLWWSGLRVDEAMSLHWTDPSNLMVDLSGKYPMFQIQAHAEKGRKFRLLPMAPEFAGFLESVPRKKRRGLVFRPQGRHGTVPLTDWVSKTISKFGRAARVQVSQREGSEKWASAHDLRRAFGIRWSSRVDAKTLMEMMRHESIVTTQQFYLLQQAELTAARIAEAMPQDEVAGFANTSTNTSDSLRKAKTK
ncbi:site-specific tyrosine recombinase XerD [Thalassoglobus neptunius]|uniref:Site-specific tyrosine recombinase XerD n=1 Tax=Thalassoglobus neptunius TaxID=1938619 RepID=A0A5C5X2K5_9PLAN|nr:site-specific integrase [Thalassoglobus neptunius]TWT57267.1 site-specific tyrosine recombinase XerD [Thalassoglobus neptunius]